MRVLVRPPWPNFLGDRLFEANAGLPSSWMAPAIRLRQLGSDRGYRFSTWDQHPLANAEVVLFMDLPTRRAEIQKVRREAAKARFILMLVESPLGKPHFFRRENHAEFDAILTYNPHLVDNRRYFHYHLSLGAPGPVSSLPFSERRPLILINSNRLLGPYGLLAPRSAGLTGLPGIGWWFTDWKFSLSDFRHMLDGELYSRRRRIARLAEVEFPGLLDVFGTGWRGEPMSWIHRVFANRTFANARGEVPDKFAVMAQYRFCLTFENMTGDLGYISEKLFDALFAGTVPIYLGDERIGDYVDPACFVNGRRFLSDRALLEFVRDCPESEWMRLRAAGAQFLKTPAAAAFGPDRFAETVLAVVDRVVGRAS